MPWLQAKYIATGIESTLGQILKCWPNVKKASFLQILTSESFLVNITNFQGGVKYELFFNVNNYTSHPDAGSTLNQN